MGRSNRRAVFRELLRREFGERFQGSVLGVGWPLLLPVGQLLVLSLVFTWLLPARGTGNALPYWAFLALGLWPWQLFANAAQRGCTALTDNAALIGKVALPQGMFVLARVVASVVPDILGFGLVLALVALLGHGLLPEGLPIALLALAVILAYALAAALLLATLQVFLRDTSQVVVQWLMLGFFLSPVLYDRRQLPEPLAAVLGWNPLAPPIEVLRAALTGGEVAWAPLGAAAAASVVALWFARGIFSRARPHLEDFL
jgi:lipopolysaccharide transport system permease protein